MKEKNRTNQKSSIEEIKNQKHKRTSRNKK